MGAISTVIGAESAAPLIEIAGNCQNKCLVKMKFGFMEFIGKHPVPVFLSGALLALIFAPKAFRELRTTSTYEHAWHSDAHKGIIVALAKNKVRDCGGYVYKRSMADSDEYLVRCQSRKTYRKNDSEEATYILFYQVRPSINSVQGPFFEEAAGTQ
jgi:hypothetical protein